jgi:hypothetical protein
MRRVGWFFFILGISLGVILGLYYAWEIEPIEPKDAVPRDLQDKFQDEIRTLIAIAFAHTGDLNRAERRLELLSDPANAESLRALAQQHLADGRPEDDVRSVARLAAAFATQEAYPSTPSSFSKTATPTPSLTPTATITPAPTETATPIPNYQLRSKEVVCDPDLTDPLIQILVLDDFGNPIAGVEIIVRWDEEEDHFFTGLKPEMGLGYGDFTMSQGLSYTVTLSGSSETTTELSVEECMEEEVEYPGSWLLTFVKP